MKTGGLHKSVLASQCCHPKLLADCTDHDRKIGEVIATPASSRNAIGSLLDLAK